MKKESWITQKEMAAKLIINGKEAKIQVINNWIRRGKIKSKKLYGVTLVDENSLNTK